MDTTMLGPPVEYTEVPPLPARKTYPILNHFVINTVDFVNKFSAVCEQKLSQLERQLERLEITMATLEAKLGSIPGLETVTAADYVPSSTAPEVPSLVPDTASVMGVPPPPPPPPGAAPSGVMSPTSDFDDGASMISTMTSPPPPPPPAADVLTVRKDPKFALYVRMLNMGVPLPAVQMKMKSDGLNPDAVLPDNLDRPSSEFAGSGGGGGSGGRAPARGGDSDDDSMSSDESDAGGPLSPPPPPPPGPPQGLPPPPSSRPGADSDDDDFSDAD